MPAPDLTIFLDISPEKAKERGGYGLERYEKEEMQKRVREIFGTLGNELSAEDSGRWTVVDASEDLETVKDKIWAQVRDIIMNARGPVTRLWT